MAVHQQIAELVEAVGSNVFTDADAFRGALDDFLDDEAASRGELNLLIDCVRLGVFGQLRTQLDNGADPEQAVDMLGDQLARDRGQADTASARWALAVLAFAIGRLPDEAVVQRRLMIPPATTQLGAPPSALPAPPPPPPAAAQAGGNTRPLSQPVPPRDPGTAVLPPPPPGAPLGHAGHFAPAGAASAARSLPVDALVLLAIGAIGLLVALVLLLG